MPIADRFRHSLVVKRRVAAVDGQGHAVLDDYHQPTYGTTTVATVAGLVQPRTAREMAALSQAGASVSDHVGYMAPLASLGTDCWIEVAGIRFDVVSIADAAGLGHHYEVGLRRVG